MIMRTMMVRMTNDHGSMKVMVLKEIKKAGQGKER